MGMDRVPLGADAGVLSQMRLPGGGTVYSHRHARAQARAACLPVTGPPHLAAPAQCRGAPGAESLDPILSALLPGVWPPCWMFSEPLAAVPSQVPAPLVRMVGAPSSLQARGSACHLCVMTLGSNSHPGPLS